jgi:hypothetical protein
VVRDWLFLEPVVAVVAVRQCKDNKNKKKEKRRGSYDTSGKGARSGCVKTLWESYQPAGRSYVY